MLNPIFVPSQVRTDISEHVKSAVARATDAYFSGGEDEDTLTGQLGAYLRNKEQAVIVDDPEIGGRWKWSIDYTKFRGRGNNATEKLLGADGILELRVDRQFNTARKAALFQAKNAWTGRDSLVLGQSIKLSTWREAAFIVDFERESTTAYSIDDVIRNRGRRPDASMTLDAFINTRFRECLVGDGNLGYDPRRRRLQWRDAQGVMVSTAFSIGHRIRMDVEAPKRFVDESNAKEINNSDVHSHRMQASPQEILGVGYGATPEEVKGRARALAGIYHPDALSSFLGEWESILATRRMQEINLARDELEADTRHPSLRPQNPPGPSSGGKNRQSR